ncbi:MAG: hypothetical protein ABFS12_11895, partial [Bacteroidota bacterium]
MQRLINNFQIIVFLLFLISGCSSSLKTEKEQVIPMWAEIDSEIIADSLVQTSLQAEWNTKFKKRKPIVVVGKIFNESNENIDVSQIEKDIERSLLNSGEISFVASKKKRETIRYDRKNRADFKNEKDFKKYLKSLRSDYFFDGTFNLTVDSTKIPRQKTYTLNLEI